MSGKPLSLVSVLFRLPKAAQTILWQNRVDEQVFQCAFSQRSGFRREAFRFWEYSTFMIGQVCEKVAPDEIGV
jgi:hypothetical protein